ncbi:2626_t:CDS:2 [Rhizophagus irregularis]|nr:2626_t:CDS:2 [Rhizophagus irregularis]
MSFTIWIKYNNEQAVSVEFQTGTIDKLQPWIILRKHEATVDLESDEIVDQSFANTAKAPIQVFTTEPGERYQIVAFHITTIRKDVDWSQIEDKAVEDETLLAVKNFLNKMFKLTVEIFPHRIMYKNQESIMEWDGILTCDNKVFLLETKHKMTAKHIENLINRLSEFQNKLLITDSLEFKKLLGNIMLELLAW